MNTKMGVALVAMMMMMCVVMGQDTVVQEAPAADQRRAANPPPILPQVQSLQAENLALKNKLALLGFKEPGEYFPIPPTAAALTPTMANGLVVQEIATDVWFLTDAAYTSAVIDVGNSLVVIDAPPSYQAQRHLEAIQAIGRGKPVSHFIFSHAHNDHVGNAYLWANRGRGRRAAAQPQTLFIAHALTAELLKRNTDQVVPTSLITKPFTQVRLGNKNFEFHYFDNAHVEGNIVIFLPAEKVLMYVDIVFPQWSPFYNLGMTQDAIRLIGAMDTILSFPFTKMIGGHLGRYATRKDVLLAKGYLTDMQSFIQEGFKTFNISTYYAKFGQPEGNKGPNTWAVLHNWMGDMAFDCSSKMIGKYKDIIAGIDIYTWVNCWLLRESVGLFLADGA
jgi:glyoxylase-like metal-dependent hydrolase (beta-lactamase superfamily II)